MNDRSPYDSTCTRNRNRNLCHTIEERTAMRLYEESTQSALETLLGSIAGSFKSDIWDGDVPLVNAIREVANAVRKGLADVADAIREGHQGK